MAQVAATNPVKAAASGDAKASGDAAAFERVMRENNQRLYRVVRGMVRSDDEAEDIVQETYVRAFRGFAGFEGRAAVATWLIRIAINETRDRQRRSRPTASLEETATILAMDSYRSTMPGSAQPDPEAATARVEIRRYLEKSIDGLPDPLRDVFALRALDEFSTREVAELLDLKPETVKTRYHRAKAILREAIDAEIHAALHDAFPFGGARCNRIVAAVLKRIAG